MLEDRYQIVRNSCRVPSRLCALLRARFEKMTFRLSYRKKVLGRSQNLVRFTNTIKMFAT